MTIKRLEVSNSCYTARNTQIITIHSSHLERRQDVSIYNIDSKDSDVPIIILLHGVYGNHWVWMHLGGVHQVYEKLKQSHNLGEFILVMPSDGGFQDGSAYLPTRSHGNYEKWIMEDVLNGVINTVTGASPNSRVYLTGLSMGGYGALRLGAKYATNISGIAGHSSITHLSQLHQFTDTPLTEYTCEKEEDADILYWIQKNASQLPPLRLDCGEDDLLFDDNIKFSSELTRLNIPHQFDRLPGEHSWDYWNKNIQRSLLFFHNIEYPNSKIETI